MCCDKLDNWLDSEGLNHVKIKFKKFDKVSQVAYLQELWNISNNIAEHKIILLVRWKLKPAQLSDSGIESDQSLSNKRSQLWSCN